MPHEVLEPSQWRPRQSAHYERAQQLVSPFEARRKAGRTHPIEDFLFTYYMYRPNQLRRWHPGFETGIIGGPQPDGAFYTQQRGIVFSDPDQFRIKRSGIINFVRRLMRSTLDRSPALSCFGLHEWAMVYRQSPTELRHDQWPLRLSASQIAAAVEERPLACTHFDAFRFFTQAARPLNSDQLARESQESQEQPGCLHAGMDLYKWAYKLIPMTSSGLVLDCFDLAMQIRYVDMRASPYDFSSLGITPIAIETPTGRSEYSRTQKLFAERAAPLRQHLLSVVESIGTETS
ncbi:MAG: 3-methyladenine DNA glycosylase [Antricoccus sp.]